MADAVDNLPPERRGVVAVIRRGEQWLVIRRAAHIRAGGAYCFPGGTIEAGESEEVALVRELREELNVDVRPVQRIWESVTPWRVGLAWWTAELIEPAEVEPHPDEVASVHWVNTIELSALEGLLPSNHQFLAALECGEIKLDEPAAESPSNLRSHGGRDG